MDLKENIQIHDELNPKLFDGEQLKAEVRDKIIEIVLSFENYINCPISIIDIQLVGSNASYNYTDNSDIDIHVIASFEAVSQEEALLQSLYDAKKSAFNKDFDITIKGLEVELYVENVESNVVSNGIYSVCEDMWVKKPQRIENIEHYDTSTELESWTNKIKDVLSGGGMEDIVDCTNSLYLMRKNSIAVEGEYGKGNQLFKEIRDAGLIRALKDAYRQDVSKILSLEALSLSEAMDELNA